MPGPWPKMLGVFADKKGRFFLASSIDGNDNFLGGVEPGEKLVAVIDSWSATGLVRGISESTFEIFDRDSDEKIDLITAFQRIIPELMERAYQAGLNRALEK